jgi:DnaJ-domain-containing protein 1
MVMSISKRLFDMARAELNDLLDKASSWDAGNDPDEDLYRRYGLDELTDEQLEAELERRARTRAAVRDKINAPPRAARSAPRPETSRPSNPPPRRPGPDDEIRRAYAALEVPPGSDFETVRKSYRALMRKYHPDRHTSSPEKLKAATELAQKLTEAYRLLQKRLRKA